MADKWQDVGGGDLIPAWDFKSTPTFQGVFIERRFEVGPNKSNLYIFETVNGAKISIWGTALLDSRFAGLQEGEEVRVEFLGDVKGKGPKPYHNFAVKKRVA